MTDLWRHYAVGAPIRNEIRVPLPRLGYFTADIENIMTVEDRIDRLAYESNSLSLSAKLDLLDKRALNGFKTHLAISQTSQKWDYLGRIIIAVPDATYLRFLWIWAKPGTYWLITVN